MDYSNWRQHSNTMQEHGVAVPLLSPFAFTSVNARHSRGWSSPQPTSPSDAIPGIRSSSSSHLISSNSESKRSSHFCEPRSQSHIGSPGRAAASGTLRVEQDDVLLELRALHEDAARMAAKNEQLLRAALEESTSKAHALDKRFARLEQRFSRREGKQPCDKGPASSYPDDATKSHVQNAGSSRAIDDPCILAQHASLSIEAPQQAAHVRTVRTDTKPDAKLKHHEKQSSRELSGAVHEVTTSRTVPSASKALFVAHEAVKNTTRDVRMVSEHTHNERIHSSHPLHDTSSYNCEKAQTKSDSKSNSAAVLPRTSDHAEREYLKVGPMYLYRYPQPTRIHQPLEPEARGDAPRTDSHYASNSIVSHQCETIPRRRSASPSEAAKLSRKPVKTASPNVQYVWPIYSDDPLCDRCIAWLCHHGSRTYDRYKKWQSIMRVEDTAIQNLWNEQLWLKATLLDLENRPPVDEHRNIPPAIVRARHWTYTYESIEDVQHLCLYDLEMEDCTPPSTA